MDFVLNINNTLMDVKRQEGGTRKIVEHNKSLLDNGFQIPAISFDWNKRLIK